MSVETNEGGIHLSTHQTPPTKQTNHRPKPFTPYDSPPRTNAVVIFGLTFPFLILTARLLVRAACRRRARHVSEVSVVTIMSGDGEGAGGSEGGVGVGVGVEGSGVGEGGEGARDGGDFGERGYIMDDDTAEARAEVRRRNARARLAIVLMIALLIIVMMLDGKRSMSTTEDEVSTGPSRQSQTGGW